MLLALVFKTFFCPLEMVIIYSSYLLSWLYMQDLDLNYMSEIYLISGCYSVDIEAISFVNLSSFFFVLNLCAIMFNIFYFLKKNLIQRVSVIADE